MLSIFKNQGYPKLQSQSLAFMKAQKQYLSDSTRDSIHALRPTFEEIRQVPSEVFSTPYTHFFRGRVSEYPHVFDRRAGWTPQYTFIPKSEPSTYPKHCFQAPCNNVPTYHEKDCKCCPAKCINLYR